IKLFGGLPMIAWPLRAARESGCFDRIIVSTDDPEIDDVSRTYEAEVPFVRPPELSDDHCGTVPVIAHAVRWLADQGTPPADVCCIYATAPFLRAEALQEGLKTLYETGAD